MIMIAKLSKWTWLWIGWIAAFVVIETLAALSKSRHPRTLTEHLLRWFPRPRWRWLLIGIFSFLVWHFASGPQIRPVPRGGEGADHPCPTGPDASNWCP